MFLSRYNLPIEIERRSAANTSGAIDAGRCAMNPIIPRNLTPQQKEERRRARAMVTNAIRRGEMPRAAELPCNECGKPATQYHHFNDYTMGNEMRVVPLCTKCHSRYYSTKFTQPATLRFAMDFEALGIIPPQIQWVKKDREYYVLSDLIQPNIEDAPNAFQDAAIDLMAYCTECGSESFHYIGRLFAFTDKQGTEWWCVRIACDDCEHEYDDFIGQRQQVEE